VQQLPQVQGDAEPGYGPVADAFGQNFAEGSETGAAFCLHVDGRVVVDLWGGVADPASGRPYGPDTLQLVFSTTKGATAICANLLAQRGQIDLDAPVASYWPEFAAAGKETIPVRWLLSHRAGLPALDTKLSFEQVCEVTPVVEALAAQPPLWEPGTVHGYHALTFGWLVGEVVRRVTGRSVGRFFADEVADPLGLEFWIGLPEEEEARVAPLSMELPTRIDPELLEFAAAFLAEDALGLRALTLDGALGLIGESMPFNTRECHATEMPAANGITTARSLSRLYAATVGEVDGVRLFDPATAAHASEVQSEGPDRTLVVDTRYGCGFMLDSPMTPMLGPRSFGHAGAGGSLGFADADANLGFGYVMNRMGLNITADPRATRLVEAVRRALG